jgi:tyrosyl-tRNA synthetase
VEPFLSFEGENAATMVNNLDWTAGVSAIDFLRDIGKHFPVNRMLARDTVKRRLESGISYTEFSYVLLQSMDFLSLHREHGVTLQFGGSDQWGNITGGAELIRRATSGQAHAFATPLVTKADGTKYGKTEGGALWLDPEMMSPYAFHQFWLNVEDEKVVEMLKIFTFLTRDEIEQAKAAASALFGGGDLHALSASTLAAALGEAGSASLKRDELPSVVDLFVEAGLAKSKGEARRTVSEGGAYLNNTRIEDPDLVPTEGDLLGGSWLVLRRGKKNFAGVEVS